MHNVSSLIKLYLERQSYRAHMKYAFVEMWRKIIKKKKKINGAFRDYNCVHRTRMPPLYDTGHKNECPVIDIL